MTTYIDDFSDCENDEARARWLLRCPLAVILRDEVQLRRCMRTARFEAGLAYLDAELTHLRAMRRGDGNTTAIMAITVARGRLFLITGEAALVSGV